MRQVDPKTFRLPPRTTLERAEDTNNYYLVIHRKTRIIMSDGRKILEKVEKIRGIEKGAIVSLKTTALCVVKLQNS